MATDRFEHLRQRPKQKPKPKPSQKKTVTATPKGHASQPQPRFAHLSDPRCAEGLNQFQKRSIAASWDRAMKRAAGEPSSASNAIAASWDRALAKAAGSRMPKVTRPSAPCKLIQTTRRGEPLRSTKGI